MTDTLRCSYCGQGKAQRQCGHACGAAFYCGWECANAHYETHELACIEARAGNAKRGRGRGRGGAPRNQAKVHKVMEEFKHHQLHSGSKKGPIVTNRKQAIAIALAEARRGK